MFSKVHFRKEYLVVVVFMLFVLVVTTCGPKTDESRFTGIWHPAGLEFAGSETCVQCHSQVSESFGETPHFKTSAIAAKDHIMGSFDSSHNVLVLTNRLKIVMEKMDSGMYQTAVVDGEKVITESFDFTIGSGRLGQTYLYWKGDSLFQLPASYHAGSGKWTNSPGYPTDRIIFNRPITARCLECHATYFKPERSKGEIQAFDKSKYLLGVNCERCHGPAARHVNFHQEHPDETKAKFVTNPRSLSRKQKLDNCGLCHSGMRNNFLPSFSYLVGDDLNRFFFPTSPVNPNTKLEVHGNQVGLLAASKCFKMSEMDCSTCHDVHKKETKNIALFSARCMSCHQQGSTKFCKQPSVAGLDLTQNCIDCHMPSLPSEKLFLQSAPGAKPTPFFIRTHLVGQYKNEVAAFLNNIGQSQTSEQ